MMAVNATRRAPARPVPRRRAPTPPPTITALDWRAARALLRRNHVGRIAFGGRDRVDLEPIHHVLDGDWIFGRTSPGTKLAAVAHSPWVAFEVDEVAGLFDWRSVVVHGTLYTVAPDDSPTRSRLWSRGVERLRRLIPETATPDDPVPARTVVFGIHIRSLAGRAARPGGVAATPRRGGRDAGRTAQSRLSGALQGMKSPRGIAGGGSKVQRDVRSGPGRS